MKVVGCVFGEADCLHDGGGGRGLRARDDVDKGLKQKLSALQEVEEKKRD